MADRLELGGLEPGVVQVVQVRLRVDFRKVGAVEQPLHSNVADQPLDPVRDVEARDVEVDVVQGAEQRPHDRVVAVVASRQDDRDPRVAPRGLVQVADVDLRVVPHRDPERQPPFGHPAEPPVRDPRDEGIAVAGGKRAQRAHPRRGHLRVDLVQIVGGEATDELRDERRVARDLFEQEAVSLDGSEVDRVGVVDERSGDPGLVHDAAQTLARIVGDAAVVTPSESGVLP